MRAPDPGTGRARSPGFSLLELMLALVVAAVLWMVALPAYRAQLLETRRQLAWAELFEGRARQEQFFGDHRRYASDLVDLGFPADPYGIDASGQRVAAAADGRTYRISLLAAPPGYTLRAEPQLQQAADGECGVLTLDAKGLRSASGDGPRCW